MKTLRIIDGETEKLCLKCGEWWPATTEFFYRAHKGGYLRSPCKACISEQKQLTNQSRPCCVPGCSNPRHRRKSGVYDHRCYEHRYHEAVAKPRRTEAALKS